MDMQWPEGTLTAQKQWIGRSVGASIEFGVEGFDTKKISVHYTPRYNHGGNLRGSGS